MVIYENIAIQADNLGGKKLIYDKEGCAEECLKHNDCKAFTLSKYGAYRGCFLKYSNEFLKRSSNI